MSSSSAWQLSGTNWRWWASGRSGPAVRGAAAAGGCVVGIGSPEPPTFADHEGPFASHYDSGRVTRHVATTFEWAELARRAIADYPAIEQRSGIAFHRPVGVVYATHDPHSVAAVVSRLAALRIVVDRIDTLDDPRLHVDPQAGCFVEGPPAGHVDPRRMTAAQIACGVADGAHVERSVVERVEPVAGGWRLRLAGGAPSRPTGWCSPADRTPVRSTGCPCCHR